VNRDQLQKFIQETYDADPDFPWMKYPSYMVFRHRHNRKWFALIMDITKDKLGLPEKDPVDVLNVKCDPFLISSLRSEDGFFPAYHMNKNSWISIALDSSADDEKIKWLLDMSYEMTIKG